VTGYGMAADRRHCLEAGFDYHLLKPVDFDELNALLQEHAKAIFNLQGEMGADDLRPFPSF
jgi:CheY-like chemotaxis protein